MKTNLKSFRLSVMILAGLMAMSLCFSGCSPIDKRGFRAKRLEVDLDAMAKLRAQAEKKKADAEAKRRAQEAQRIADQNAANAQPEGDASNSGLDQDGTQPAVEGNENGEATTGVDGNSNLNFDPINSDLDVEPLERKLSDLTQADSEYVTSAQETFTTTFINDGSMTPEQLADAAVNFDPRMGLAIFGMTVNKSLEAAATADEPAVYNVTVEVAVTSPDSSSGEKIMRSNQFEVNFSLQQNGRVVALNPNYVNVLNPEDAGDSEVAENIVIYSACGSDDCKKLQVFVGIQPSEEGQDTEVPEQIAAFLLEEKTDGSTEMKLIASSVGVDNVHSVNDVFVKSAVLKSERAVQKELADLEAGTADTVDTAETTEEATETGTSDAAATDTEIDTTETTEEATLPAPVDEAATTETAS